MDPHAPFLPAFWITLKRVILHPVYFFKDLPEEGGIGIPLAFALVIGTFGWVAGLFWQILAIVTVDSLIGLPASVSRYGVKALLMIMIFVPLILVFAIFLTSYLVHLGLMVFQAHPRRYQVTFKVIAYSQAAQWTRIFPLLGGLAATCWVMGLEWVGLKAVHRTSYLKAFGSLIFPLLLTVVIWVIIVLFFQLISYRFSS